MMKDVDITYRIIRKMGDCGIWKWAGTYISRFSSSPDTVGEMIESYRCRCEKEGKEMLDVNVYQLVQYGLTSVEILVRPKRSTE